MKPICFFVIGPESTGSTYVAQILNYYLNGYEWDGWGWNDDDAYDRGIQNGFTKPIGTVKGTLVCHRSIPFNNNYPPIDKWIELYDCKFIWAIRDIECSHKSREQRWGKKDYEYESQIALEFLDKIQSQPLYYFSYEALVYTKHLYLNNFYDWIDNFIYPKQRYYPNDIKNMNKQYIV